MKELAFLLSLKNNLSAPLGKAQQSVESFAKKSASAFKQVGIGAAGLWGVVQGVKGLLNPAAQVRQALDELSARNVGEDALGSMYKSAQRFSTAYGKSAAEFIASGTLIKRELTGLADHELPRAAVAINTLAVATKSSAEQAAGYMSEMANSYRSTVREMGNVPFADMMASKGAYMMQNFGASVDDIRALVKSSKGTGTQHGAGMDEQLSVLGLLSKTQGTEAGGIYDAFLKNAVKGGKQLGMSFTDAQGKLLQFPDILQKLQAKFGHTIEGNTKAQRVLNGAFGEGAKALTAAWGQADALRKHMRDMGNTQGLDRATEMAGKMADMWQRVDAVWERIRVSIGMRLIPAISPLVNYAINAGTQFAKWLDMFPNISRWIGYIALGILALGAAGAVITVIAGLFSLITSPILLIVAALAILTWAVYDQYLYWSWAFGEIGKDLKALWGRVVSLWGDVTTYFSGVWDGIKSGWRGVVNFFISIMPIDAFLALFRAISVVFNALAAVVTGVWNGVLDYFSGVWASIKLGWEMVVNFFSGLSPVEAFTGFVDAIGNVFSGLWDYLTQSFGKTYNWIVSKLNKIPGVNIDLKPVGEVAPNVSELAGPAGLNAPQIERGGIAKTITSSAQTKVTDNSRHVDVMNVYPQNGETFDALMESRELAAG